MSPLWLKSLPWSTILSNAPLVVEGAKKLASLVKSKSTDESISPRVHTFSGDPSSELGGLRARLLHLEAEQRQTAELVAAMAETQAQMAQVLEALRRRARLNLRIAVASLIGVAALLLWSLIR
jgi:hypothetical protein